MIWRVTLAWELQGKYDVTEDKTMKKAESLDSPRLRFNGGYHDGADNAETGARRIDGRHRFNIEDAHFDHAYALGFVAGWDDMRRGDYSGNSDAAWKAFKATGKKIRARRTVKASR